MAQSNMNNNADLFSRSTVRVAGGDYKLIITVGRGANDEPLPVEIDVTYRKIHLIPQHSATKLTTDLRQQCYEEFSRWN